MLGLRIDSKDMGFLGDSLSEIPTSKRPEGRKGEGIYARKI